MPVHNRLEAIIRFRTGNQLYSGPVDHVKLWRESPEQLTAILQYVPMVRFSDTIQVDLHVEQTPNLFTIDSSKTINFIWSWGSLLLDKINCLFVFSSSKSLPPSSISSSLSSSASSTNSSSELSLIRSKGVDCISNANVGLGNSAHILLWVLYTVLLVSLSTGAVCVAEDTNWDWELHKSYDKYSLVKKVCIPVDFIFFIFVWVICLCHLIFNWTLLNELFIGLDERWFESDRDTLVFVVLKFRYVFLWVSRHGVVCLVELPSKTKIFTRY